MVKKILFIIVLSISVNSVFWRLGPAEEQRTDVKSDIVLRKISETKNMKKKVIALIELAEAYKLEGRLDKSISTCEEVLNLEPDKKRKQNACRILGEIYSYKKEYFKAIEYFQEAIALTPKHLGVRLSLAQAYKENDLNELAIQEYLKILQINSKNFDANFSLGNIYKEKGFYNKAIKYYRRAVLTRMDEQAYKNLAICYEISGDLNLAISMMRNAIAVKPTYDGYTHIARLYFAKKKYAEAEEALEKAIDIDLGKADAYVYMGLLYLEKGDLNTAKKYFFDISRKFKDLPIAHFFLAEIYYKQKLISAAKIELKAVQKAAGPGMLKEYSAKFLDYLDGNYK